MPGCRPFSKIILTVNGHSGQQRLFFYAEKVDQAKAQLERQNLELEALKLDNESLADQLIQLEQGNQELTEQLEQLKGLLIQLEQRSQQDG